MSITYAGGTQLPLLDLGAARGPQKGCSFCAGLGTLTATDIFCGAGGSSLGLEFVSCPRCGRQLIEVTQCLNHWDLAVEAHNANFPDADHDVTGVQEVHPSRFGRTDIAWFSPECVYYTSCRGKQEQSPEAMRSRATFNDITRFTGHHRYDAVIVENVIEARLWCEHEDCRCGHEFNRWFRSMEDLGYEGQIVYFNSQFALVPQSRDRMYVVFNRVGAKRPAVDYRPISWCPSCQEAVRGIQTWKPASKGSTRERIPRWGRYGPQYLYLCPNDGCRQPVAPAVVGAKTIIDWDLPIERIGDKSRPLAPNTRKRIKVGWENIGRRQPVAVQVGGNLYERPGYARVWALDDPLRTITTTSTTALVTPERTGSVPAGVEQPIPTVAGRSQLGLVTPAGGQDAAARSMEVPMHTVVGTDRLAMVVRAGGQSPSGREAGEPMNTVTAHDRQIALVVGAGGPTGSGRNPRTTGQPLGTIMGENHSALVMPNMTNNVGASDSEPVGAVTSGNRHMLVQVSRGSKSENDHRCVSIDEPTKTIAGHGEFGIVAMRNNGTLQRGDEPIPAVVGSGTHHGMLVYNGVPGFVRDLADAAGTITGRDKQSLLVPYYTTGVARPVGEPLGTVTARDREALVITEADIDDCYFRMLQWPELLRGQMMHVHPDGAPYQLTARRRNQRGEFVELSNELRTRMIGNAVSSPVATMLGWSVASALLWPS